MCALHVVTFEVISFDLVCRFTVEIVHLKMQLCTGCAFERKRVQHLNDASSVREKPSSDQSR